MRKLTRQIEIKTEIKYQNKNLIVRIVPPGILYVRQERSRTEYEVPLDVVFMAGARIEAMQQNLNNPFRR